MSTLREINSSPAVQLENDPASTATTAIFSPTEIVPVQLAAPTTAADRSEDDRPATEGEILEMIAATERELSDSAIDHAAAMELIAARAELLTDARGAAIELLEGDQMVYHAATGTAAKSLGLRLDIRTSLSGLCVRTGEILRCDDTEKDSRVDKAACRWVNARSMVVVPLAHRGQMVGVLKVLSPAIAAFGDPEVQILRTLSRLLAEAIFTTCRRGRPQAGE